MLHICPHEFEIEPARDGKRFVGIVPDTELFWIIAAPNFCYGHDEGFQFEVGNGAKMKHLMLIVVDDGGAPNVELERVGLRLPAVPAVVFVVALERCGQGCFGRRGRGHRRGRRRAEPRILRI